MTSTALLDIGFREYYGQDGVRVAEDAAAFADDLDAGAAALDQSFPLPAIGYLELSSQKGVVVFATIAGDNIENDDTIEGYIVYQAVG